MKKGNGPYDGLIQYIAEHAGCLADVYVVGQEECWELEQIEVIFELPSVVLIGGVIADDGSSILINMEQIQSIVFNGAEGDDGSRHDVPVEEKKTLMSETLKVVNA